jgi:hypothetical protein
MLRTLTLLIAAAAFASSMGFADAKSCRDAKGKFTKCPVATPAPKQHKKPCHDPKTGKFVKCTIK